MDEIGEQMDLSAFLRSERAKRARDRREITKVNKSKSVDLTGSDETVIINSRDDSADRIEILQWSPETNKNFLALPRLVGDRDPTVKRINGLKLKIAACRLPFLWAVALNDSDGKVYRINGNTTASIAMAYPELFAGARIVWCEYLCNNLDEIQLIYTQFDSRLSTRTMSSALLPYIVGFGITMSPTLVSPVISGIGMVVCGDDQANETVEDRIMSLHESLPFIHWLEDNVVSGRDGVYRPFVRVPILAAIYATWLTGMHEKAAEFWRRVIHTDKHQYGIGDPALTLNSHLVKMSGQHGRVDRASELRHFSWCTLAWNAYLSGRSLIRFQIYAGKAIPVMIGLSAATTTKCKLFQQVYSGD